MRGCHQHNSNTIFFLSMLSARNPVHVHTCVYLRVHLRVHHRIRVHVHVRVLVRLRVRVHNHFHVHVCCTFQVRFHVLVSSVSFSPSLPLCLSPMCLPYVSPLCLSPSISTLPLSSHLTQLFIPSLLPAVFLPLSLVFYCTSPPSRALCLSPSVSFSLSLFLCVSSNVSSFCLSISTLFISLYLSFYMCPLFVSPLSLLCLSLPLSLPYTVSLPSISSLFLPPLSLPFCLWYFVFPLLSFFPSFSPPFSSLPCLSLASLLYLSLHLSPFFHHYLYSSLSLIVDDIATIAITTFQYFRDYP
jgi:hypothetical protein